MPRICLNYLNRNYTMTAEVGTEVFTDMWFTFDETRYDPNLEIANRYFYYQGFEGNVGAGEHEEHSVARLA